MSEFQKILRDSLADLGVGVGTAVMVHSDLTAAGAERGPDERLHLRLSAAALDAVIRGLIGDNGVQIAPAFSFSWTRHEPFDPERSPATLGGYADYLRQKTGAQRSSHPLMSIIAEGPDTARYLVARDESSFGLGSVYANLAAENVLQLMLGTPRNSVNDFVQTTHPVPYRYPKFFFAPGGTGYQGLAVCRHDVRFVAMGDRLRTALEGLDQDLRSCVPQRRVGILPVWAVDTRTLIRLIRTQLDRNVFSFQIEPERAESIRRLALYHKFLGRRDVCFFAMNRGVVEKWVYGISNAGERTVFVMNDGHAKDASRLLDLADFAAGHADSDEWFASQLYRNLEQVFAVKPDVGLKEIALRLQEEWAVPS